jgi:hypothetical protein
MEPTIDETVEIAQPSRFMLPRVLVICVSILVVVSAGAHAADQPESKSRSLGLSLEDCIELALQNNLDVQVQRYRPEIDQYAHAAGIVLLTGEGRIARYFYGVRFPRKDLRLGLVEAADNRIVAETSGTAVGTVGRVEVEPNATNVVPGRVELGVDRIARRAVGDRESKCIPGGIGDLGTAVPGAGGIHVGAGAVGRVELE